MAEHRHDLDQRYQQQLQQHRGGAGPTDIAKSILPEKRPSKSTVLAFVTLLPTGGILLLLSGLTLAGTLVGLALTIPVFVICSPVLVPAALTFALAVAGFLAAGAMGVAALSSFSWAVNFVRGMLPRPLEQAARRMQETTGQIAGQKAREVGQKAQEGGAGVGPGGRSPGRS